VAFVAASRDVVDRFWSTGTEAGFTSDGEPGPRPQYGEDYYGAFLLDPHGNSVEAVHNGRPRVGPFDHLWIRVQDVAAAASFYELIAPWSGFPLDHERDGFAHFRGGDASFSLVADGAPTEQLHLAFGASDNRAVEDFHRAAVEAGYRDNGPAGERLLYHAGYYGAFVLDPDGNNIEVVNHNR
jgi:predicted lactoylglutathione lyase